MPPLLEDFLAGGERDRDAEEKEEEDDLALFFFSLRSCGGCFSSFLSGGEPGGDFLFPLDLERPSPPPPRPRPFSKEPLARERERDEEYERRERRRSSFLPRRAGGDADTLRFLLPVSGVGALDGTPLFRESLLASSFLSRLLEDALPPRRPPPRLFSLDEYFLRPPPPRESGEESDPEEEDEEYDRERLLSLFLSLPRPFPLFLLRR